MYTYGDLLESPQIYFFDNDRTSISIQDIRKLYTGILLWSHGAAIRMTPKITCDLGLRQEEWQFPAQILPVVRDTVQQAGFNIVKVREVLVTPRSQGYSTTGWL